MKNGVLRDLIPCHILKIHPVPTTKKKAFYIGSNDLSTSVMTRGDNTVSLNTDIG